MADKESQDQQPRGAQHGFLQPRIKQRFEVLKKIGCGAYGHVWKVRCRESKNIYAIKKVFLAFQDDTDAQRVYREISLLLKIRSDFVVKLKQIIPSDNSNDIYLLFEYLESDVFQAIKNRVLDPTHKKFIVYQLACALKYMHSAGVIHRDLKPSNVLINSSCDIKICDFGLSRSLTSQYFNRPIMTEFIATRWYRAPEVLLGSKSYSTKSDMWSLGCLIYELYSRRTLLPGENTIDQITKILELKGKPTPEEIESFKSPKSTQILTYFKVEKQPLDYFYDDLENNEIKLVLDHLLEYNQNKRWSAEDLLNCDFLKEFRGVLPEATSKLTVNLELNDNRKYGIERYKSQILGFMGEKSQKPKQRPSSKRIYLSHRASNHKSAYSLHGNLSKLAKTSTNSTTLRAQIKHKQHQSAHVSPNIGQKSIQKLAANARRNILKVSQRLTADLRKKDISNEEEKETSKNTNSILHKPKSKKYLRPERVIKQQTIINKQNYQNRFKMLKKQKTKHYRSGLQV